MALLDPTRPLLRQRDFAALWWGQLISILGERLSSLALLGLIAEHTHQLADANAPLLLALLANVSAAPVLLFAPFTGAWVDRWNLRRVLIISDLLRTGLVAILPAVYGLTHSMASVYLMVFALFTCNVFFTPSKSAITPELVPPAQLLGANALLALAGVLATAIGAPLGGWMVDRWGWERVLMINAATYLVSVVSLWRVRYRPHAHHAAAPTISVGGYVREVREGWRVVRHSATVGLALVALAAVWVGGGFLNAAGNPHIQRAASNPGMLRVGVLLFVLCIGSALGTWWVNTGGRAIRRTLLLGGGLLLVSVGMAAFALSSLFAVFAVAGFVVGLAAAPAFVLSETLLQEGTEPRQRGRVFSARDFLMRLVFVLGGTTAGLLSRSAGTRAALLTCAGVIAVAGLLALTWGRRTAARSADGGASPSAS
jgi:DHA3 family macrolide efflux protein-like MFS transporter